MVIEKTEMDLITKFSYLKEIVNLKVRMLTDCLALASEGNFFDKSILLTKNGKLCV